MNRLTIVIPAFNVETYIAEAVRSALQQTIWDIDVIVVDDGSTDRTAAVLAKIRDSRLHVIHQANAGLSAARNTGIRATRTPYVGLLDGDDLWRPVKAETQLTAMREDARIVMSYSDSAYIDNDGMATGEYLVSRLARPTLRQMLRRNHVGNGSTPILKTAAVQDVGLFDERLRSAEDYHLWCRLLHRFGDGALLHIAQPLTQYRVRSNSLSATFENFLSAAEMTNRLLRADMPDLPAWVMREGLAGFYRIAARKSASFQQPATALRYLRRAVELAPWLPVTDPRFLATILLILSGGRAQKGLHSILAWTMNK